MIELTSAQLDAWIAAFIYPLTRILGLTATAPPFSNAALSTRIRLILGIAITLAIAPALPAPPPVQPSSGAGLAILAQQMLIGVTMGFMMRLTIAAVDFAGEIIGLQIGLGFATFYDPMSSAQTPVISNLLSLLATLILLSIDGHLMILATLAQSFYVLPIGATTFDSASGLNLSYVGGIVFSTGMLLALPVVCTLLIVNTAMGVLARAAPQLNLFAVGFPITLAGGFVVMILCLNYLATPIVQLFEYGLQAMLGHFVLVKP